MPQLGIVVSEAERKGKVYFSDRFDFLRQMIHLNRVLILHKSVYSLLLPPV